MIRKPPAPPEIVILSVAFLFIFMGAGAQQQFLAPYFTEVMNWSPVHRGFVPAAVYLSMTVWRVPAVWVVSKIGERTAMLLGGLAYVLFPLGVYYISSWAYLILAGVAWGAGATLMWVTSSIRVIDAANTRNYGKTSGFFIGSVHMGILVGYIVLSRVADVYSLHSVFIVASALTAVGWITMLLLPSNNTHRTSPSLSMVLRITRLPNWGIVAALLGLAALGWGLMLVPLGEALVDTLGVGSLALAAIYPFGRLIISLSGGWLSDIIGRRVVIAAGFFLAGTGLAVTAFNFGSGWAMAVGIFSVGLLGGIAPAMGLAFVGDVATSDTRLMVHASLFAFNDFGVAVAILGGQFLRDTLGGFEPTFGVFAALLLVCGVWAYVSFRPVSTPVQSD
jgi:MFS family permease